MEKRIFSFWKYNNECYYSKQIWYKWKWKNIITTIKKEKNIIKNEEERKWYKCPRNRKLGNRNTEVTLEIFMKKKSKASMGKIAIEIFLKKRRRENTVEIIIKS